MAEVRKNAGTARLSESTLCCICGGQFLPGQQYVVDRDGHNFFYSHLGCRDGTATAEVKQPHRTTAGGTKQVKKPIPDVADADNGVAEIFYRGHRYDAVTDEEGGPVVWGLFHHSGDEPLAVERDPEVGLGGLVSWLLNNR